MSRGRDGLGPKCPITWLFDIDKKNFHYGHLNFVSLGSSSHYRI